MSIAQISSSPFVICENQKAHASYDKQGKAIPEGRARLRIGLKSFDSRFLIAGELFHDNLLQNAEWQSKKKLERYVPIQIDQHKILLKIKSIARRFHLTEQEIRDAAQKNTLVVLLISTKANEIINHYHCIISKYRLSHSGKLKSRLGYLTDFDNEILMKTISLATQTLNAVYYNDSIFYVLNGQCQIAIVDSKLGEGYTSKAYKCMNPDNSNYEVLKISNKNSNEFRKSQLNNEFTLLNEIHANALVWGIQMPHKIKALPLNSSTNNPEGFIAEYYDGGDLMDLALKIEKAPLILRKYRSTEHNLIITHQILFALKFLEENHILHGDIKPDNVFLKMVKGFPFAHFADFGSAVNYKKNPGIFIEIHSEKYIFKGELKIEEQFYKEGKFDIAYDLGKKRDVLSTGITLFYLYNSKHPYKIIEDDQSAILTSERVDYLKSSSYNHEWISIIENMLDTNVKRRASASKSFFRFNTMLKNNYPDVYEKIQQKMNEYSIPKKAADSSASSSSLSSSVPAKQENQLKAQVEAPKKEESSHFLSLQASEPLKKKDTNNVIAMEIDSNSESEKSKKKPKKKVIIKQTSQSKKNLKRKASEEINNPNAKKTKL